MIVTGLPQWDLRLVQICTAVTALKLVGHLIIRNWKSEEPEMLTVPSVQCHDNAMHRCDCDKYLGTNYKLLLGHMSLLLHRKVNIAVHVFL